jgi:xanthine dehydrogenase accessory factor
VSPFVLIKGAGEMASACAWRLHSAHIRRLCMLDLKHPLAVRRTVSFCPALEKGRAVVEGIEAIAVRDWAGIRDAWARPAIAVALVEDWQAIDGAAPDIVVDAILAKRNLGTTNQEAPLVIGLGPGFEAGRDVDLVIETNRGHNLGRIIEAGCAEANTGIPGSIAGHTADRVVRAPAAGVFASDLAIGDRVEKGDALGRVAGRPVAAGTGGVLRGLIRSGTEVPAGLKLGDIDPRGKAEYCATISDKARAIAGSVLEAVMRHCNRRPTAP